MDQHTIDQLEELARAAGEAVDDFSPHDPERTERRYRQLRARASRLNGTHGWASQSEFDAMFPTLEEQALIDALDENYGVRGDLETGTPFHRLVRDLWAWTIGLLAVRDL